MKKVLSKSKPFLVILAAISIGAFIIPFFPAQAVSSELEIISREEWEANDDYLLDDDDQVIWPTTYEKPVKFIVHHTAGSNGSSNPKATIRAIYYYHAQILGWGDVGYNYLIDTNGNIYEGRRGGDGAVGAHAYRDSGCNVARFGGEYEGLDFNRGTIGIALLGNYEEGSPSQKALDALANLIAHKSVDFGISPKGKSDFKDLEDLPNIVGHQDVDCTLCPGENLASELAAIRETAYAAYEIIKDTGASFQPVAKAKFIKQSATTIQLEPGETATISATYENAGNFTWRRYFTDTVYLSSADYNDDSLLNLTATAVNHIDLTTANVEPGQSGKASFTIKAPDDCLSVTETFYLAYDSEEISGTRFTVKVEVIGLDYAAEIESQNILPATFVNSRMKTTFQFVNRGVKTWTKDNTFLEIYDLNLQPSVYLDQAWPDSNGQIILAESEVKSGQTGTFIFYLKSPANPGLYRQIFKVISNDEVVINSRHSLITRVDSHFQAKLISQNIPPAILTTWRPKATIKFKNTGAATWDQNIRLNVYDLGYQPSRFADNSWSSSSGQFRLKESTVAPGETGTFEFVYRNRQPGIYKQIFRLESVNQNISIQNGRFVIITRVD